MSHDLEPMRTPIDTDEHSRPFDPHAYVQLDDFAAALADSAEWGSTFRRSVPGRPGRLRLTPRG